MAPGSPPVLAFTHVLSLRAAVTEVESALVAASAPIRHRTRQAFHQYLPSPSSSSSTLPAGGRGVEFVFSTKSGSSPVFGAYLCCIVVIRFWWAVRIASHAESPVALRNARKWSAIQSDDRV